jgi:transposase-like protein
LQKQVREHVEAGAAIFTDELKSYDGLSEDYKHVVINHAVECADGNVHTNGDGQFLELAEARNARYLHSA